METISWAFFKFRLKANATLNIMYSIYVMMTRMIIIIIIINSLIYLSLPPVMFRQSSNFFGVAYASKQTNK